MRPRVARSNAARSVASSRSRATNGVAIGRVNAGAFAEEPRRLPRWYRLGLSWECERRERLGAHRVDGRAAASLLPIRISPEPAACSSRAATLTASPVASFWCGADVAGDDFAGVHARARLDLDVVLAPELVVQSRERLAHLDSGAHRPQCIVLVQHRQPEDRHDRVADELLDGAPMSFEHLLHGVEVLRHDTPERLGVEPFAEARRADKIGEHDGDRLADLGRVIGGTERGATRAAEPGVQRVVLAAVGAGLHVWSVRRCAGCSRAFGPGPRCQTRAGPLGPASRLVLAAATRWRDPSDRTATGIADRVRPPSAARARRRRDRRADACVAVVEAVVRPSGDDRRRAPVDDGIGPRIERAVDFPAGTTFACLL